MANFTQLNIELKEKEYDPGKKTILTVEDNTQMLKFIMNNLSGEYNFYYAVNGKDALDKLKSIRKPDIIISDIMMDQMDGYEFYDELMKDDSYRSIPFIFLTAKTRTDEKLKGLKKGAVDFITKPFDMEELKAKLSSLLRMKDALNKERIDELMMKFSMLPGSGPETSDGTKLNEHEKEKINGDDELIENVISRGQVEIFSLLEKGFERKEISDYLDISLSTVKTQLDRMFKKFNVKNKTELINIIRKTNTM